MYVTETIGYILAVCYDAADIRIIADGMVNTGPHSEICCMAFGIIRMWRYTA